MSWKEYTDYLHDILDAVRDAQDFVKGMTYEQFVRDKKTTNAVIRSIEVIGEAAKNVPASLKKKQIRTDGSLGGFKSAFEG